MMRGEGGGGGGGGYKEIKFLFIWTLGQVTPLIQLIQNWDHGY